VLKDQLSECIEMRDVLREEALKLEQLVRPPFDFPVQADTVCSRPRSIHFGQTFAEHLLNLRGIVHDVKTIQLIEKALMIRARPLELSQSSQKLTPDAQLHQPLVIEIVERLAEASLELGWATLAPDFVERYPPPLYILLHVRRLTPSQQGDEGNEQGDAEDSAPAAMIALK